MAKMICDECLAKSPSGMSCIHTFGPRNHVPLSKLDHESERDAEARNIREMIELARHGS